MQSAAQREVTGSGAGASGQGEPGQPFAAQVVDLKWRANYWRSQHARAKERIAAAQAQGKRTQQELAEARRQMRGLQQQVQALERENAGLRQEVEGLQRENRQLRQTPFRKRSEKGEGRGRDGGAGGQSEPEAGRSAGGSGGAGDSREGSRIRARTTRVWRCWRRCMSRRRAVAGVRTAGCPTAGTARSGMRGSRSRCRGTRGGSGGRATGRRARVRGGRARRCRR